MTSLDVIFGRNLLREVMKTVRKHTTVAQRKSVWVYNHGRGIYEVQSAEMYPNRWYGRASSAYEAKAKFWEEWIKQHQLED